MSRGSQAPSNKHLQFPILPCSAPIRKNLSFGSISQSVWGKCKQCDDRDVASYPELIAIKYTLHQRWEKRNRGGRDFAFGQPHFKATIYLFIYFAGQLCHCCHCCCEHYRIKLRSLSVAGSLRAFRGKRKGTSRFVATAFSFPTTVLCVLRD